MKKSREENLTNYDRKNYNKEISLLSNKNIGLNDKNNGVITDAYDMYYLPGKTNILLNLKRDERSML